MAASLFYFNTEIIKSVDFNNPCNGDDLKKKSFKINFIYFIKIIDLIINCFIYFKLNKTIIVT